VQFVGGRHPFTGDVLFYLTPTEGYEEPSSIFLVVGNTVTHPKA